MKRFDLALAIGLAVSILLTSFSAFGGECGELREQTLRLHILANSDSEEDQALKLAVRDAVLAETEDLFTSSRSKEEARSLAEQSLGDIERAADAEIARLGYGYRATASVENRYFGTTVYDDFTMPAGRYDAVRIEIGGGDGKNWWCVMFPPMCVPAASERDDAPLEERIRSLGQPARYKPAFAVVEAIESLRAHLGDEDDQAK